MIPAHPRVRTWRSLTNQIKKRIWKISALMFTSLEHLSGHIVKLGLDLRQQILDLASVRRSANVYNGPR